MENECEYDTLRCEILTKDQKVMTIIDTGASISIISEGLAEKLKICIDRRKNIERIMQVIK